MKKGVFFVLVLVLFVLLISSYVSADSISSCQPLDSSDVYTLTQNVSSSGTCFTITATDVTLDCDGYTINFSSSSTGYGVYSNSNSTTVRNCVIRQSALVANSRGIVFFGVNNGIIENNRITTEGNSSFMGSASYGIYLYESDYNLITNTNTTSSGGWESSLSDDESFGLVFYDADYNNVTNYRESGAYNGIHIRGGSDYNNFVNSSSIVLMDNLYIIGGSSYNNFTGCYFKAILSSALLAFSSDQNSFFNSVLINDENQGNPESIHFGGLAEEYNYTNCTLDSTSKMHIEEGTLNVFWLADVYVNDSNGNPINGVNVSAYDKNNNLGNTQLTNSSGYIQRIALREYLYNVTGVYYDSNYTFNTTKSGYSYDTDSGTLNLTTNHIGSNKVWITLTDDNALTALQGINPVNNYKSNSSSMTFDFKCSYNSNVSYIQLFTNTTGTWHANYTNNSYTNGTWLNITVPGIQNGFNYKWAVFCNTTDSSDWTGNKTFNVDATPPVAEQGTNPVEDYNNSGGIITFDFKCTDNVAVDTIELWGNWSGTWQALYSNSSYQNNTWLNVTLMGIPNGKFKWAVYCKDTSGLSNFSGNRTLNVTDGSHVSDCTDITLSGNYILNQSILSNTTCINILADDITLDCNGYNITFANSEDGVGVYSNSDNTTVKNCIIQETERGYSYGIEFYGANNGLIDNNNITTIGTSSYGIYLKAADYNRIVNTNTTTSGYTSYGLSFDGADYNNVTNYQESGGFNGISLGASYNNFVNVTSITGSDNLMIASGSSNNNFTGCYFGSTSNSALFAGWSDKISFVNSVLTGAGSISTTNSAEEINLTNCTLSGGVTVQGGTLNVFWLADVYVNDSNGDALSGANVTAKNKNNVLKDWGTTNFSGYTKRLTLREYLQNSSGKYYDTDYNFSASKNGYTYDAEQINLTSNAIDGYLGKVVLTLESTSAPNISSFVNHSVTLPNSITLAALVKSDSDFTVEWSKISGPGSVTFSNQYYSVTDVIFSSSGDYVLRITANSEFSRYQDVYVKVIAEPISIKVKKSGTGSGNVSGAYIDCGSDCSETFDGEAEISLTATASSGSVFIGWVGSGCLGNSSNVCNVTVNGTKEVTAFFDTNTTGIRTFYVATNGSDSNNGSIDFPWLTIQHAADTAVAGDKVIVKAGTYNEMITVEENGTEENPIVFEGERNAVGEWLTIVDPSTDASSGWSTAPEIGPGVYKKDVGFAASELIINNKRVAYVISLGDMTTEISYVYSDVNCSTGTCLMNVEANALVNNGTIRYWDGVEALWGKSGNIIYLRLRNGSNPNGMDIRVIPPYDGWLSTTFYVTSSSYLDFRNFRVIGYAEFWITGSDAHNITIENNYLSGGWSRVSLFSGPYDNLIRNNYMTGLFYGYSDTGAAWTDSADYRYTIRGYNYLVSKFIMGGSGTQDQPIDLYEAGDNNIISGNHIYKGIGSGIVVAGNDFDNPTFNTEIYGNIVEGESSIGILLRAGETGTKVHDNFLIDNSINMRFHEVYIGGETNRTVYVYRNKFWEPENAGDQIYVHHRDNQDYDPTLWVYQNSFTGGRFGFGNGGSNPDCCSMPHINLLNNVFSGVTYTLYYGSQFGANASAMGIFDYNLAAPLSLSYFPPYPVWYGEHNVNQTDALWNLDKIPDFSLESNSPAIDSGIDLSQDFTINGTTYPALPGMEPGYFLGSAPDMGAVEYDNTTMIITRENPIHGYITDDSSITFEFKCLYNAGVDTIELFTDTTGDWHLNYTNNSYTSNTWLNITRTGITQGTHKWMIYCNGTDGDYSITGNRTFTVDLISPTAEQGTNPTAGYQDSSGSIKFDMKCSDNLGVSSIQLQTDISGSLQTEYSNYSYTNDTWLNVTITGITSGDYIWQVYCEDSAGNADFTSSRAFSSTYAEEEQQEQKKGGGGGGGGNEKETPVNQTSGINNVGNPDEVNTNNQDNTNQNQEQGKVGKKSKLNSTWIIGIISAIVIIALIIVFSVKKKNNMGYTVSQSR